MNLFHSLPYTGTDFEELIINQSTRDGRNVYGPPTYINHTGVMLCLLARGLSDREHRVLRVWSHRVPKEALFCYQGAEFVVSLTVFNTLLNHGVIELLNGGTDWLGRDQYVINDNGYRYIREWKAGYMM